MPRAWKNDAAPSTIVADRLCGAVSDPIVRNAQEKRQLALIGNYLEEKGHKQKPHPARERLRDMTPGTYAFRMVVIAGEPHRVNIPVDVVIQPKKPSADRIPVLIEAKSAGDFTVQSVRGHSIRHCGRCSSVIASRLRPELSWTPDRKS